MAGNHRKGKGRSHQHQHQNHAGSKAGSITPSIVDVESGVSTPLRMHTLGAGSEGYGTVSPVELREALSRQDNTSGSASGRRRHPDHRTHLDADEGEEEVVVVVEDDDDFDERDERKAMLTFEGEEEEVDEGAVVVEGEDTVTTFVWILVSAAAISGLLFGYDTAAISGMLVIMGDDLGRVLSDWDKELITTATTFGALLGGLGAGALSDYTGRKMVIAIANAVFISGAAIQAACHTVSIMVIGRFVVGLGVGLASCVVPLYIGELAPTKIRGKLVTINATLVTLGQVIAYATGAGFQDVSNGWRWIVGLGTVPALIQLSALGWLPESPRILLLQSRVEPAREILSKIYPLATAPQLEHKVQIMRKAVAQSKEVNERTTFSERLSSLVLIGGNRRALIIGCGLQISQQFSGFNTLMYYSATIFAMLGFHNATVVGLIIATVNFLFTLVALKIVDPLGKRTTLLYTEPIIVFALLLSAFFFRYLTASTGGVLVEGASYSRSYSVLLLLSMLVYVASYATGLGNIPWQQGELFKLEVRGLGTSISTAVCWSGNLIISGTFLTLMNIATPAGAFAIYAAFGVLSWLFCYYLYPETSGLSLEEVSIIFEHGFGVEKSREIRRDKLERARMAEVDRLIAGNESE